MVAVLAFSYKCLAVSTFCTSGRYFNFPPKLCGNGGYRGGKPPSNEGVEIYIAHKSLI